MKKQQINYKDQVVGYVESIEFDMEGLIDNTVMYLFDTSLKDEVIDNIKRSLTLTFDAPPDTRNIDRNKLFQYELFNNKLIIRKI